VISAVAPSRMSLPGCYYGCVQHRARWLWAVYFWRAPEAWGVLVLKHWVGGCVLKDGSCPPICVRQLVKAERLLFLHAIFTSLVYFSSIRDLDLPLVYWRDDLNTDPRRDQSI
jgi:hypothetical protein